MLGGTFDPIHYAHLAIAEQVREELDLAQVLFVPAAVPVHRPSPVAGAEHRARMVELAIADNPHFQISRIELDGTPPNYTLTTLERLRAEAPEREVVLIMSVEAARQMSTWHEPAAILELARVAVVPRAGYVAPSADSLVAAFPGRRDRFILVNTASLGHSATDIRRRLAAGRSIRYLVPPAVEAYIAEHRLYGPS